MNNFQEFEKFVLSEKDELKLMNGKCDGCPKKKVCLSENKANNIDSIINMGELNTRFPRLLGFAKKNLWALELVPAGIYKKFYGLHSYNLPCQFEAGKVIKNLDKIEMVYNMLSDDLSKKIFLGILMYRLTFKRKYIINCTEREKQYFIPEYTGLGSEEVYIDCGAYIGDTFEDYISYNGVPKKSYFFEPDTNNAQKLNEAIKNKKMENISTIIDKGVYEYSTKLWFVSGKGGRSYFSTEEIEGAEAIAVACIDDCVKDAATFIKMDIEGFEQMALKGAKSQIIQNNPKLAICIYHSIQDLWEIPLLIKEMGGYSNFKVRHYTENYNETVFYAF